MSAPFDAAAEVSREIVKALLASEDFGLADMASFVGDPNDLTFEVSLFNDEGGVIHQGEYKVVPA